MGTNQSELILYSKSKNINGGSEHNTTGKFHEFSDNCVKPKLKIGEHTRNSAAIDADLVPSLPRGWLATNRRGKPGKSKPVGETRQIITKERNLELEDNDGTNKPGNDHPTKSGPKKRYFCSSCNKAFASYFAFGGHRAFHVREERKWLRHSPSWAALLHGHLLPPEIVCEYDCWWCKKGFSNRLSVEAHGRFCYDKKRRMPMGDCRKAVIGRNFDLNELPPEAFLPEEILRRR